MALTDFIGPAISLAGSLFGGRSGASATSEATDRSNTLLAELNKRILSRTDAGATDAFGNRIGEFNEDTGFTTTLSPEMQTLADSLLRTSTNRAREGARGSPFTLGRARGIVESDDNAIKNAILNPALKDAATIDARAGGGTSNAGNIVSKFMSELLPQIQLGGETRALDLFNRQNTAFDTRTGNIPIQPPGAISSGEIGNLVNAGPRTPGTATPDLTGVATGNAISGLGSSVGNFFANQEATNQQNRLIDALSSRLTGNQGAA